MRKNTLSLCVYLGSTITVQLLLRYLMPCLGPGKSDYAVRRRGAVFILKQFTYTESQLLQIKQEAFISHIEPNKQDYISD